MVKEIDLAYWNGVLKNAQEILDNHTEYDLTTRIAMSEVRKGIRSLQLKYLKELDTALEEIVKKQKTEKFWRW